MLYNQLKLPERKTKAITVRYNPSKEKLKKFFLTTTTGFWALKAEGDFVDQI